MRILYVIAALAPAVTNAQEIRLGPRTAAITEQFSDIVGFAELGDGRAFVTDRVEQAVFDVNFTSGTRKLLGRNGTGPNEYLVPYGVIPWKGDTLLLYDPNNRRYLKLLTSGLFTGTVPFVVRAGGGGWSTPRAVDASGRIYWDTPILQMQPTVERKMQSQIHRWLPGADSVENVSEFADHGAFEHRFRYRPFPQTDAWFLDGDGRLGILSAAEYRLRWYANGKLVETGPVIPYDRVRIGAAERDAFREKKAMEPMSGASANGGGMRPPLLGRERAKTAWPDSLFPEFIPPFEISGAMRAPNGTIWVKRTNAASERSPRVDVLDARGSLRGFIRLAPRSKLLAVSATSVYVIAADEDGLQTLERYALPAALR